MTKKLKRLFALSFLAIVISSVGYSEQKCEDPARGLFQEEENECLEEIIKTQEEIAERNEQAKPETVFLGKFRTTAYCSCSLCNGQWASKKKDKNGIPITVGATGVRLQEGRSIAVDPKVIPLGSKLIINGKTYVAEDTGGAIKGKRLDMYFNFHDGLKEFGVKQFDVYLVKE